MTEFGEMEGLYQSELAEDIMYLSYVHKLTHLISKKWSTSP